jgi:hypothetical protein
MGECEDVNPGTFHVVIANWLGIIGKPLVFDEARYNQVWNYPLYGYESTTENVSQASALAIIGSDRPSYAFNPDAAKFAHVTTNLTYADALPMEEAPAGTAPKVLTVDYILELSASGDIIGGEWSARSRSMHPDFVWVPLEAMQGQDNKASGNPYLDIKEVLGMWAESAGYGTLAAAPKLLEGGTWNSTWGQLPGLTIRIDGGRRGSALIGEEPNVMEISRDDGVPAVSLELNGAAVSQESDKNNVQTFLLSPLEGINFAAVLQTIDGKQSNSTVLVNALR